MRHRRLYTTLIALLLATITATAQQGKETQDTAFQNLYRHYMEYYTGHDADKFYEASRAIKEYCLKQKDYSAYFKLRMNEVLYETENGKTYSAIKEANQMLDEMKSYGVKSYDLVYSSLATIYESRGNYRMANHYFQEALKNIQPTDSAALVSLYSRIAFLKMTREPDDAWEWNERLGEIVHKYPIYQNVYLGIKGTICFFRNDKKRFYQTYKEYQELIASASHNNDFGNVSFALEDAAYQGRYQQAIALLDSATVDFDTMAAFDFRIKIYQMAGQLQRALDEANLRRDYSDSLNSNMLFDNLNEINVEMGIAKMNEQNAREREIWLAVVILLLIAALGLIVSRYFIRRRYQKKLLQQNRELEVALLRAEESDKMKTSFIEHVSHEIRTPLNVITGFAQIITNTDYQLDDAERNQMLQSISKNTQDITNIVNDLLEIAQDESKEHYTEDDDISVNQLCREVMGRVELQNNGRLELRFNTQLSDENAIRCNRKAIEKILDQLLGNALKFTNYGFVELRVHKSPDNGVVRFIVTDTGIGISEEYSDRVFERFFKVDPFKQGFGLGLTTSRKIARLLGGDVAIDQSYSNGARFVLTLPTAPHDPSFYYTETPGNNKE